MNIETVAEIVSQWIEAVKYEKLRTEQIVGIVQCQLLLLVYDKLKSIDDTLITIMSNQPPGDNR